MMPMFSQLAEKLLNARHFPVLISLFILMMGTSGLAAPRIKVLKLSITNPADELRLHENIVVSVAELKKIAPDFKAGDVIVTTSDARTLEEDKRTLQTIELPSQADDLDGDNKYDELAFQIDLQAKQTRIVTITYGDAATMQRLRSDYPKRTAAKFTMKFDGLAWESEATAWRIYFDKRNAIDIWGSGGRVFISRCLARPNTSITGSRRWAGTSIASATRLESARWRRWSMARS